jgi:tRNA(fMet)-specific endonuclease VapC
MGILIDSSLLIEFEKTGLDTAKFVEGREEEEVFLSVISASELLHGVHRAKNPEREARRLAFVEGLLSALPVLAIDLATARCHARLWAGLARTGRMIGVHDSWLAASCLAHGLKLATRNVREFEQVPGLELDRGIR